jgi:trigger factor
MRLKISTGLFTITVMEVSRFAPAENNQELWDKVYGEGTVTSATEFEAKVTEEIRGSSTVRLNTSFDTDARDLALGKVPRSNCPRSSSRDGC